MRLHQRDCWTFRIIRSHHVRIVHTNRVNWLYSEPPRRIDSTRRVLQSVFLVTIIVPGVID